MGALETQTRILNTSASTNLRSMRLELSNHKKDTTDAINAFKGKFEEHTKLVTASLKTKTEYIKEQINQFGELQKKHNEQFKSCYVEHNDHMLRCHELAEDIKKEYSELMQYLDIVTGVQDEWINRVQSLEGKIASRENYLKKVIVRVQTLEKVLTDMGAEIPTVLMTNPMRDPNVDPVSGQIRREEPDYVKKFNELVEKRNAQRAQLKQFE